MIQNIVLIGAGNLATQLGLAFYNNGVTICQVYSRTTESAKTLALQLNTEYTSSIEEIQKGADLYIIALSDKAILPFLQQLKEGKDKFVHTAGSVPLSVFENYTEKYGVFYPLQTFSKQRPIDFTTIPICIESNDAALQEELLDLAGKISGNVHLINSEERKQLHISAVFTCNFANHMYSIGQQLLRKQNLSFDLLKPLILETAKKVQQLDPLSAQTGPAIRFDEEIINNHQNALKDVPDLQKMYRFVSENIYSMHKKRE